MAESTAPRADVAGSLGGLVKLAVDLRLILLLIAMVVALLQGADRGVMILMLLASYAGLGVLLWWDRLADALLRHPWMFIGDLVITVVILMATGTDGPFVLYTISTAFLAGVLYGHWGAAVFGVGIALSYIVAASRGAEPAMTFIDLVGIPTLIAVAGFGAAAIRELLLHTAEVEVSLADAVADAAASEERARLAREMHDTLGKTLHGISLSAQVLPAWVAKDPDQAARKAAQVAAAAETAAGEARQLISDLRADSMSASLDVAIRIWAEDWAAGSGIRLSLALAPIGAISASSRYELFTILREALRNVEAHSGADQVSVYLSHDGGSVCLEVADDGHGLRCTDLEKLAADGHYGLVGMGERAARAGGALRIHNRGRGRGTTIRAEVPATSAHDVLPFATTDGQVTRT